MLATPLRTRDVILGHQTFVAARLLATSAVVMGGLAIARVPYGKYLRFVWPLLLLLAGLTIVVLAVGAFV